jgi:hypothetical protein
MDIAVWLGFVPVPVDATLPQGPMRHRNTRAQDPEKATEFSRFPRDPMLNNHQVAPMGVLCSLIGLVWKS